MLQTLYPSCELSAFDKLSASFGSTSATTNTAGQLVSGQLYKAWGESRYSLGTSPTKYTYTGQYSYTSDFGLMFYNARWYDSSIGRFAQADTIVPGAGNSQAWDRYAYTLNNPIKYTDPSGHCPTFQGGCKSMPQRYNILSTAVNVTSVNGGHISLGTQINSNTMLTHNHYQVEGDGYKGYDFDEIAGDGATPEYADPVGPQIGKKQEQETALATFEDDIPGMPAKLASQETISSLEAGDKVQVIYWDNDKERVSILTLTVKSPLSGGVIELYDPQMIINHGDSGGGVFFNNELIGNMWQIHKGKGYVEIAVLPANISNSSRATTPVNEMEKK